MTEKRIQHNLTMWFSQKYPQHDGCMWSVFNEDSKHKRNQGMHPGVADVHLFFNKFAGIELKKPGSLHNVSRVIQQINWGKNVIKHGGLYYIGSDFEEMTSFIVGIIEIKAYVYDIQDKCLKHVEKQLENSVVKF